MAGILHPSPVQTAKKPVVSAQLTCIGEESLKVDIPMEMGTLRIGQDGDEWGVSTPRIYCPITAIPKEPEKGMQ